MQCGPSYSLCRPKFLRYTWDEMHGPPKTLVAGNSQERQNVTLRKTPQTGHEPTKETLGHPTDPLSSHPHDKQQSLRPGGRYPASTPGGFVKEIQSFFPGRQRH